MHTEAFAQRAKAMELGDWCDGPVSQGSRGEKCGHSPLGLPEGRNLADMPSLDSEMIEFRTLKIFLA